MQMHLQQKLLQIQSAITLREQKREKEEDSMLVAYYNWCHSIGLHLYTIPTLILLVIMLIIGLVHWRNQDKREKDFEDELQDKIDEITGAAPQDAVHQA